jgi:hypothetical protein
MMLEDFNEIASLDGEDGEATVTRSELERAVQNRGERADGFNLLLDNFESIDAGSAFGQPDGGFSRTDLEAYVVRQMSEFQPDKNPLSMGSALVTLRACFEGISRLDGNEELDRADLDELLNNPSTTVALRYAADYLKTHFDDFQALSKSRYDFSAKEDSSDMFESADDIDLSLEDKQFLNRYIAEHQLNIDDEDDRDQLEQAFRERYYPNDEAFRDYVHLDVSRLNSDASGVPLDNLIAILGEEFGIEPDRQLAPLHNITQDNGWLGLGLGANGNCASVAAIKLAWAFFGGNPEQVFEHLDRHEDGSITATLRDGSQVTVSSDELKEAAGVSDWDGSPYAIDSANLLWAVAAKNGASKTGVDFKDMVEDMKEGFWVDRVLGYLGLTDYIGAVQNPSDEDIRAQPFAVCNEWGKHAFFSSFGMFDKWGATKPIEDWGHIDEMVYLRPPL